MNALADVAAELERLLGAPLADPTPLDGGITNRNYLLDTAAGQVVVRRPGKDTSLLGIDRAAEIAASRAAASLGIAPELVGLAGECLVTRYIPGSSLDDGQAAEHVDVLGRDLRRFHGCGAELPADFRVPDLLARYEQVVRERGGRPPAAYGRAREIAAQVARALRPARAVPCHNDLLPGNILRAQDGALMIVDWEYAGMGDARFDLGNLAVNNHLDEDAEARLLAAYDGAPPQAQRRAELTLMKLMSDAREAAWGVVQAHVSELDFDFDGYAGEHLDRLLAAAAAPSYRRALALSAGV
ncbi:MAG TPA: phosphotransferase [Solirubrobacteraceae bacterium]|nr:phosphotransferase [Solirubrobacteraceae bacterium]